MQSQIRVLQITNCIKHGSGVSEVIMNYYRRSDSACVLFDFMVNEPVDEDLHKEIEGRGSKIYLMPALTMKNTFNYKNELERFFKEHHREYNVVHGHTPNAAAYYMPIAKKYGVPVRIIHSHNSQGADSTIKKIRNRMMSKVAIANITDRFACSKYAAEYLYGNDDVFILNNAIDIDSYKLDITKRQEIRAEFEIDDDAIVVGHIGRMVEQKNHSFIVDIAEHARIMGLNVKLLLLGDGPLRTELERKIRDKSLDEQFVLTGVVSNPRDYYNAMDAFILPSIYEGLPVVGVEAQAAGLPTAVSNRVTPETLMADNITALPINDAAIWADWIKNNAGAREDNRDALARNGYDISIEAGKLLEKYKELLNRR